MTWPQIYVLATMILSCAIGLVIEARKTNKSNGYLAIFVGIMIGFRVVTALVLHAGGFW